MDLHNAAEALASIRAPREYLSSYQAVLEIVPRDKYSDSERRIVLKYNCRYYLYKVSQIELSLGEKKPHIQRRQEPENARPSKKPRLLPASSESNLPLKETLAALRGSTVFTLEMKTPEPKNAGSDEQHENSDRTFEDVTRIVEGKWSLQSETQESHTQNRHNVATEQFQPKATAKMWMEPLVLDSHGRWQQWPYGALAMNTLFTDIAEYYKKDPNTIEMIECRFPYHWQEGTTAVI
ncbi:MAG: hypothetical protein MMC33_010828, partial [Icmadophila ericetorum]|nr:hypothetical protein [Icmadophila ericetorum]